MNLSKIFFILFIALYLENGESVYKIPLDSSGKYAAFWSVNYQQSKITLEIHLTYLKFDWFALGFSNYGETYPADYCLLWTDWKMKVNLTDVWSDENGNIIKDKKQDCNDFHISKRGKLSVFTFSRTFDTCDDEGDYLIQDGTVHIVWLRGEGPLYSLDNMNVETASEKGMQRTQLLKNSKMENMTQSTNVKLLDFVNDKVQVPESDTTYWCRVMKIPKFMKQNHHIIQYESLIQSGNEGLIHHMELFHCDAPVDCKIPLYNGPCFDNGRPEETQVCKKVLAAWAMGASPFSYPTEAGLVIGGANFNQYVMLEVHYNNPQLKSDWVDSSGLRLRVTSDLRKYDAGIIELGLEYTDKMAIPPGQSKFILSGYCISECTAQGIPKEGITIFGSQLHTHLTGVQVFTKHVRDGRELNELNRDNHYSTHFQEIRLLKAPVTVLPGDALITSCKYNTLDRNNITLGGFAISDEMCVNYIHYYPKVQLEVCKSSISHQSLNTYFKYMNQWENEETGDYNGISENYKNIKWNDEKAQQLQQVYDESTLSMQCNSSTGARFPGDWENVPSTHILYPLPPPYRFCKET